MCLNFRKFDGVQFMYRERTRRRRTGEAIHRAMERKRESD